ncbi:E3 ubiquitin-protein ligase ZNF598-like [Acanthaster planci]|uniref:RING-type E3 ubiquitin transferase n=1 Tax=Acanthaster planci TaxID=133434 RepID=A0A8B7YGC9_ACAPL|nr:E3 ubiquitin-protein ligase ZNF598-like [Acanthaster planci]
MSKTTDSISSTCVLCFGSIKYYAVGPCNHHICLKCSTRMRVLCEQRYCAVCRAEMPEVIATAKLHPYNSISFRKVLTDRKAGIAFATNKIREDFRRLLSEVCTLCPSRPPEKSFKDLQDHLRKEHELFYCDLCIKHLKVFSSERKAYSRKDLALHRRKGDIKDTSYRGHPLCEFCDERYFDNDELLRHLRQEHYYCHFCETDGVSNQYYNDYGNLKEHFSEEHYLCEEDSCAQEQFTHAFRSSIDLKAHRATVHSGQMSRAQARQMRQLDVEINLPPRSSERGGFGGGPSFAKGRDRHNYGNREEDFSPAIHASLETSRREMLEQHKARRQEQLERYEARRQEWSERHEARRQERLERHEARRQEWSERHEARRQEWSERHEARRQEQEDQDARRNLERLQPKKKSAASTQQETPEEVAQGKPRNEPEEEASREAVAIETADKEAGTEEKTMPKKGGRTSPRSDGESKTEIKEETQKSSTNPEGSEVESASQKLDAILPDQSEIMKEPGKKKKKKKSKTSAERTDNSSENETSANTPKPAENKPCETSQLKDVKSEVQGTEADLTVKSAKFPWTSLKEKVEDFPALVKSTPVSAVNTSAASGFGFYSALQKRDTQPKPQTQPVAMPEQRSFKNEEEDFPTLSSIAGILGVEPTPNRTRPSTQSNNASAWTTPREKSAAPPTETKPIAKSKKKGKKAGKENQDVTREKPKSQAPPGFDGARKDAPSQGEKSVPPQQSPPGLPPGLEVSAAPTSLAVPPSTAPPPPASSTHPIGPPPGFGVSFSMMSSNPPPGFVGFVRPSDFQERNLMLATKIQTLLGNQDIKFDMFRSISRKFREGSLSAVEYYHECQNLLGRNLPLIFNELVSLLPDLVKQQELVTAQNDARLQERHRDKDAPVGGRTDSGRAKGKGRGSGVWKTSAGTPSSCPQCGQYVLRSELEAHLNTHQDFPSLSTNALGKQQPIPAAAPTWPRLK